MPLRSPNKYHQYRGNVRVTRPDVEPVTVEDVKAQLRLDDSMDDDLLYLYIEAARDVAEEKTGLAFITQQWRMTIDHWPNTWEPWWDGVRQGAITELRGSGRSSDIIIPRYPLQSVDSINADGQPVVVADTFIADTQQRPGRLVIKRGATWPVALDRANGIDITYTAGFGSTEAEVPAAIRLGLLQMVATMYEHRGDGCSAANAWKISGAAEMIGTYKAAML